MLKAMLINGAQATGFYNFQVQNTLNYEGWGLINLPDSLPPGITNQLSTACSTYIQDQNPTNALATGDSQTYHVTYAPTGAVARDAGVDGSARRPRRRHQAREQSGSGRHQSQQPDQSDCLLRQRHLGSQTVNNPHGTNTPPVFDSINNVQNVYLPLSAGTNFSVTVMGYRVNVNAVTAQTNNVVQDYALVISCGNGGSPT